MVEGAVSQPQHSIHSLSSTDTPLKGVPFALILFTSFHWPSCNMPASLELSSNTMAAFRPSW